MAAKAGLSVQTDSAGTGGWHSGEAPYPPMQRAALMRGYDLSALRARQIEPRDFGRFDLVLAMDRQNLADAMQIAPVGSVAQVRLFLDGKTGPRDVPDPYYSRDFEGCLDIIEAGARDLLHRLRSSGLRSYRA